MDKELHQLLIEVEKNLRLATAKMRTDSIYAELYLQNALQGITNINSFIEHNIPDEKPAQVKIPANPELAEKILGSFRDDSQFPNINEVVFKKDDCFGAMLLYGNELQIK